MLALFLCSFGGVEPAQSQNRSMDELPKMMVVRVEVNSSGEEASVQVRPVDFIGVVLDDRTASEVIHLAEESSMAIELVGVAGTSDSLAPRAHHSAGRYPGRYPQVHYHPGVHHGHPYWHAAGWSWYFHHYPYYGHGGGNGYEPYFCYNYVHYGQPYYTYFCSDPRYYEGPR